MKDELLLRLWGKSDEDDPAHFHPLLFHLLDVGFCARALWRDGLSPLTRSLIAAALCLSEADVEQVCTLLAAQHDLGKASAFQLKPSVPTLADNARAAGFDIAPSLLKEQPHGYVTARTLFPLTKDGVGGWQGDVHTARLLSKVTGGHHGTFPLEAELTAMNRAATLGAGLWDDARRALLMRVQEVLFPDTLPVAISPLEAAALVPLVGGFVSVADWLGSSKKHFEPSRLRSVSEYAVRAERQAQKAVRDFGWTARPQFAAPADFRTVFPFLPNPMQAKVAEWADGAADPYLLIVEAAMGEGKTEAALYAIDRALTTGSADGFFLALPTQATGNAMFGRVLNNYLRKRAHGGRLNFQLVHAGNFLSDQFDALQLAATAKDAEDEQNRVVAQQWFTHKKQALLAPFGVGTIDQSLLGVLQTRHWFVRLFGLAGKVVVFDEVHAYDVYMGTLLLRLLPWLRTLGCTVVLLSATLPLGKRDELVRAWDKDAQVNEAPYPRVMCVQGSDAQARHVQQQTVAPKEVDVSYAPPDLTGLPDKVKEALPDGGCAAIICNTVARAQEAFRLMRDGLPDWDVTMFHARTLANWRSEREAAVLSAFGKEGARPHRAVLVATQVAEQSLDLDFDWMASDMAPADLLLQRMGRLWRHIRPERPASAAHFLVLCGVGEHGLPTFPEYTDTVYDRYVLLRSRLALPAGPLPLPGGIDDLVQSVYGPAEPEGLSAAWQSALIESRQKAEKDAQTSAAHAERVLVPVPEAGAEGVLSLGEQAGDVRRELYEDEDPKVHQTLRAATREGRPSVSVVCTGTDTNGNALAPPPDTIPDAKTRYREHMEAARVMLSFAVSVSSARLFKALVHQKVPSIWQSSPFLRYHRTLHFDNGICETLSGFRLRLSRELGLVIEKASKN